MQTIRFLMLINHYKKLLIKLHNTLEERKLWKGEYARVIGTAETFESKNCEPSLNHDNVPGKSCARLSKRIIPDYKLQIAKASSIRNRQVS